MSPSRFVIVGLALALSAPVWAQTNNLCDQPGESPDVIVGSVDHIIRHGSIGGITAFSIGSTACNVGTCWLKWSGNTNEHPVIGQNMFRLESGRFEQIGQSWLKHAFYALQEGYCSTGCMPSPTGARLGVRCSDPYDAGTNGLQEGLGPKFEIDPFTGYFAFPPTDFHQTGDALYKHLQVHDTDLDPALNPGASYFAEMQYVTPDDATSGNGANNASYGQVAVVVSGTEFFLTRAGPTVQTEPAINAWKASDPDVTLTLVPVPQDGLFYVGSRATDLGGGTWHYEYAVHNLNVRRAAGAFHVPIPSGALLTNVGFHDVDYHSGEPFPGTDWSASVGGNPPTVSWATDPYLTNANANALRWGTLYNFRFDAKLPPVTRSITLDLFEPGGSPSISVVAVAPRLCDGDGICDPTESCERCPAECGPGPGGSCCGNGTCEVGEDPCTCAADCGVSTSTETCTNLIDDDCDGVVDCDDPDCCGLAACLSADRDADQRPAPCDCDDTNPSIWDTPGEVPLLLFSTANDLSFAPPAPPGGSQVQYELLRSPVPFDFLSIATCIGGADPSAPSRSDTELPVAGELFHYLVRARNACFAGEGPLGADSSGQPIFGACP
jgi:hypothetical protein